MQPSGVDAGLLARLAQRGRDRTGVPRVGGATREGCLPGVVAQGAGPHREQQVGVVGYPTGGVAEMRPREQHQYRGVAVRPRGLGRASGAGQRGQQFGRNTSTIGIRHLANIVDQWRQPQWAC